MIMPPTDASGYFIPTLNNTGFMTTQLDPFSKSFVEYAVACKDIVLEIGAAYGVATLAALAGGATIIANDLEPKHLAILKQRATLLIGLV